jgi:hypothetical protein
MKTRKDIIHDLIDKLGGSEYGYKLVLDELIKYLDADTIVDFVDDFSRLHDMLGYEQYEMCGMCQKTHDENEEHSCDDEDWDAKTGRPAHMRDEDWD